MKCLQHSQQQRLWPARKGSHAHVSRRTVSSRGRSSACAAGSSQPCSPSAMWTRPTPGRDEDFVKPSYIPRPSMEPMIQPSRREEQPLYKPAGPEFVPAERPEQPKELPEQPKMPERRPDPIPAGNPKKKEAPPRREEERREAPPPREAEPQTQ